MISKAPPGVLSAARPAQKVQYSQQRGAPMRISGPHTARSDVVYAAWYSGAIGASAIALFFLARDVIVGAPLATPSLLSSMLFLGELPGADAPIRLDLIALVSLVHVAAFGLVGALFAVLLGRLEELQHRPVVLAAGIFATLTAGLVAMDFALLHGIVEAMNPLAVTAGNVVAAALMTLFYNYAFNEVSAPVSSSDAAVTAPSPPVPPR